MADSSGNKKSSIAAKFFGVLFIVVGVFIGLSGGCFIVFYYSDFYGDIGIGAVLLIFSGLCIVTGVLIIINKGKASSSNAED